MSDRHTFGIHGDFIDGFLSPEKCAEVKKHTSECESCRLDLEKSELLKSTLNQFQVPDPGNDYFEDLTERILKRTDSTPIVGVDNMRKNKIEPVRLRILKTLIRLAAVITLLFVSFYATGFKSKRHFEDRAGQIVELQSGSIDVDGWPGKTPPPAIGNGEDKISVETTEK